MVEKWTVKDQGFVHYYVTIWIYKNKLIQWQKLARFQRESLSNLRFLKFSRIKYPFLEIV